MTSTLSSLATVSNELADAVERASASVVTVDARRRHPATGIVWSEDGLIVTANHVVERDEEIEVGLPDGRRIAVALVGRDPGSDIALLRAEASGLTPLTHTPAEPRVGHLSLAIGRPGRLTPRGLGIARRGGGAGGFGIPILLWHGHLRWGCGKEVMLHRQIRNARAQARQTGLPHRARDCQARFPQRHPASTIRRPNFVMA